MPVTGNPEYTLRYLVVTSLIDGKGPGTEEWTAAVPLHLQWVSELEKEKKLRAHGPVSTGHMLGW